MLTREGAKLQVFLKLRRAYGLRSGQNELVILDEHTIERPWGWVFFYTTRGMKNGNLKYAVGGNAPYIVNRSDGTLHLTGTGAPIEYFIEEYEAKLAKEQ